MFSASLAELSLLIHASHVTHFSAAALFYLAVKSAGRACKDDLSDSPCLNKLYSWVYSNRWATNFLPKMTSFTMGWSIYLGDPLHFEAKCPFQLKYRSTRSNGTILKNNNNKNCCYKWFRNLQSRQNCCRGFRKVSEQGETGSLASSGSSSCCFYCCILSTLYLSSQGWHVFSPPVSFLPQFSDYAQVSLVAEQKFSSSSPDSNLAP